VCRDLGADVAIDYTSEDFVDVVKTLTGGKGADVVFDPVGGDVFTRSTKCIAFEGRIVVVGFAGGTIAQAPTNHALIKNYSIVGLHWGLYRSKNPALVQTVHDELMRLFEEHRIAPLVAEVIPFEDVPAALARLSARETVGKIVVKL
jgi:NADPH2:quinone reductase